jgi:hypothetical protein
MSVRKVEIHTRTPHGQINTAGLNPLLLDLLQERITVAELIHRAVDECAREAGLEAELQRAFDVYAWLYHLTGEPELEPHLSQPGGPDESLVENFVTLETRRAQAAFARGAFTIWVDGQQYHHLEDSIHLAPASRVVFLRLTRLTGG